MCRVQEQWLPGQRGVGSLAGERHCVVPSGGSSASGKSVCRAILGQQGACRVAIKSIIKEVEVRVRV